MYTLRPSISASLPTCLAASCETVTFSSPSYGCHFYVVELRPFSFAVPLFLFFDRALISETVNGDQRNCCGYIHTGFIGIWQPEAGLNKHTHILTHKILDLQIKQKQKNATAGYR